MIRLLIEGEPSKSEYTFWETLLKNSTRGFKIYSSAGSTGAEATARSLCSDAQKDDIAVLGVDRYTVSTYRKYAAVRHITPSKRVSP